MSELTVFEKIGVQYKEVDEILYPVLEMAAETAMVDVGKYGRMWIEHIKVVYPERYRCLVRFGELTERASQVNETAYECVPSMALILLVQVQSRVFTAKCSEPQVGISNGMDGGSGVAKFLSLRTET